MSEPQPIRRPRSVAAATRLAEELALLEGQLAEIEANRAACIADVNARCDTAACDLIERRGRIAEVLEPWWAEAADELTEGKRKSIELGGCMIGTRAGKSSLAVPDDAKAAIGELLGTRWGTALVRVTRSLDKRAILKALDGRNGEKLAALGFATEPGAETFFVERVSQEGVRT